MITPGVGNLHNILFDMIVSNGWPEGALPGNS